MLKSLYLIFAFLLTQPAIAQKNFIESDKLNGVIPLDADKKPEYKTVIQVANVSKDDLFKRARKWFVKVYNSPKDVLQVNDPATGELVAKGAMPTTAKVQRVTWQGDVNHTLSVDVKEGRALITFTGLRIGDTPLEAYKLPYMATTQNHYTMVYSAIDQNISHLLKSLEKAMIISDEF